MKNYFLIFTALGLLLPWTASGQFPGWQHSGSIYILTTPEGADLPATAAVEEFPLLVRLDKDYFDFSQARPNGEDIRFCTSSGTPLPYQVEEWDAARGTASIWVRIPSIQGNARQELKLYWGKVDAASESSGAAVFSESNGYLSVWHMSEPVKDEVGTLGSTNVGTTATTGMMGRGRHFGGGQGIFCGEKFTAYPSGSNAHSTEAWFRAERPNSTIIGWGNEGGGRGSKVRMQLRSPPHMHVDSDFADVDAPGRLTLGEWIHVMHTYSSGQGKLYLNGRLDGSAGPMLNIKSPARMWIGGWYHHYDFVGDMDEVRVSKVARSAEWAHLQFENQKLMQALVGPVVQPGEEFSVSPSQATVAEGGSTTISARVGGAQKVYWIVKRDGRERVAAVDRFGFRFDAGRVVGDQRATVQFKAVYAKGVKTKDIAITITEEIEEPVFTLKAPSSWDGRETIEVAPTIANLAAMQAKGVGELSYRWNVEGLAVIKEVLPGKLVLKRAQKSGKFSITLALNNGGAEVTQTAVILVQEPEKDAWVRRIPGKDEMPEDNQFYARDDRNEGTIFCQGTLSEAAESVYLKLYEDEKLVQSQSQQPGPGNTYSFSAKIKPGLRKYRIEFGSKNGGRETLLHTATNLVCGDAYLIQGQSNALATDTGETAPPDRSDWIRSYGSTAGHPEGARLKLWDNAVWKDRSEKLQLGYWGMELAKRLVESQKIPICIINGAVGGTRIDQHQRNPANPEDVATIYGRLLWRARQAKLTHGIRGILWHQGENDQGADGPTGGFGWETYQQYFIELAAAWKQDYPNVQHYYVFQIWPKACAMGVNGSDNMLREVQRRLPEYFSRLGIMSTLGIKPPGGCHYPLTGWAEFARLIQPLIERDIYGKVFSESITPANLIQAAYANGNKDEISLEFDQPVVWNDSLASEFYLDGLKGKVASGAVSASGNVVTLKLKAPSTAQQITYLDSRAWKENNLLYGVNGIAALTFCNVPISTK